jgi:hypothetical protein
MVDPNYFNEAAYTLDEVRGRRVTVSITILNRAYQPEKV